MARELRFAIGTPVVTLVGREDSWERDGGPEELREIAVAADRLGYWYLTCSEHVGIPSDVAPVRGSRYYDPLPTFGFMAGFTSRIRFMTHVLVMGYHHPLAIAKRYGTLDRISGGRLMLGIGVGSLEPEFDLLGAEFERRGERYEDALAALRAALGRREPAYRGSHYAFEGFIIDPCAVQERVPVWLGGRTPRSLRRALVSADGWNPFGLGIEQIGEILSRAREWPEWKERDTPLEIGVPCGQADVTAPGGEDALLDEVGRAREAGASVLNVRVRSDSLAHYLDQIAGIAERVAPRVS